MDRVSPTCRTWPRAPATRIGSLRPSPGSINYTSPGVGTTGHLGGELLKLRAGFDMVHVPYQGVAPASNDVLGGRVEVLIANMGSLAPQIRAGTFTALAQTGPVRWPDLPDVPTLSEFGIDGANSDNFQALFLPAGVPDESVRTLAAVLTNILGNPETRSAYLRSGLDVVAEGPSAFRERVARETAMYRDVIEKAGRETR